MIKLLININLLILFTLAFSHCAKAATLDFQPPKKKHIIVSLKKPSIIPDTPDDSPHVDREALMREIATYATDIQKREEVHFNVKLDVRSYRKFPLLTQMIPLKPFYVPYSQVNDSISKLEEFLKAEESILTELQIFQTQNEEILSDIRRGGCDPTSAREILADVLGNISHLGYTNLKEFDAAMREKPTEIQNIKDLIAYLNKRKASCARAIASAVTKDSLLDRAIEANPLFYGTMTQSMYALILQTFTDLGF